MQLKDPRPGRVEHYWGQKIDHMSISPTVHLLVTCLNIYRNRTGTLNLMADG